MLCPLEPALSALGPQPKLPKVALLECDSQMSKPASAVSPIVPSCYPCFLSPVGFSEGQQV